MIWEINIAHETITTIYAINHLCLQTFPPALLFIDIIIIVVVVAVIINITIL